MKSLRSLSPLLCVGILALVVVAGRVQKPLHQTEVEAAESTERTSATAEKMAEAARVWLDSLPQPLKQKARLDYDDPMRLVWHYYPRTAWQRTGVTLKELNDRQKELFMNVIRAATSQRGYRTAVNLMQLEAILRDIENTDFARKFRDPERFYLTVFGQPGMEGRWSWKVEGHHLLLNYVIEDGQILSATPFVFGANPGRVPSGPERGLRILPEQEDLGRQLFTSLGPLRRQQAAMAGYPPFDVLTNADTRAQRLPVTGLPFGQMTDEQQQLVDRIIQVYTRLLPDEVAQALEDEIERAGKQNIHFTWAGSAEPGRPHYYHVNGPGFVVEYCNTQNSGNHIHVVWRDYDNDFAGTGNAPNLPE